MKYDIVTGGTAGELRDRVQNLVDQGWRPVGGVAIGVDRQQDGYGNVFYEHWFHQTVVKDEA